jgi:hypothetical protein
MRQGRAWLAEEIAVDLDAMLGQEPALIPGAARGDGHGGLREEREL